MGFASALQAVEQQQQQQGGYGSPVQYPTVTHPQYGAPQPQHSAPQPQYGAPQPQYGAPQPHYGMPQPQYGALQPQYGAPQPQAPPQQLPGLDSGSILGKLRHLVAENALQAFYPEQRLQALAAEVAAKDLAALGRRWRLPPNLILQMTALSLYDTVILADDSGSMSFAEGGTRIEDLKAMLARIADAATVFDTDGITVRFMNGALAGDNLRDADQIRAFVAQARFEGMTPLGTMLDKKILRPLVLGPAAARSLKKPVLCIIITDGEPTGEPSGTVKSVIKDAKKKLASSPYGAGAVAFQFAQVGRDQDATKFLGKLDTDSSIGGMVDATSYFELEQEEYRRKGIDLTVDLYMLKLLCGGIDRSLDEQDEQKKAKRGSLLGRLFK